MNSSVDLIADFAHSLRFSQLPDAVVHHCKRTVVDTFGVALGAFDATPSRIARAMAQRATDAAGAHVIGIAHRTLPEAATFANGVMVRYLDGNDAFPGGGGHPSDVLAAVLAAAEVSNAGGPAIISAIVVAYEVYYNLWSGLRLRDKGMDNVIYTTVGAAAGAAKVLGLDRERIAEAISLAVVPNIALDVTRYGRLSMWKGCAGANAARNGIYAVLLAAAGMTGPEDALDGEHGLQNLTGGFKLQPFGGAGQPFRISETTQKRFLASGFSNAAIDVALQVTTQVGPEDIDEIRIYTTKFAWDVSGRDPEKWRPSTRESADHSIPYIVAATLVDRGFSDEIFSSERLRDPRIHALIDRMEVAEDPELTRLGTQRLPCRIEVRTRKGERKVATTDYPRGHYKNPMTDEEVNAKFASLAQRALQPRQIAPALDALWRLDSAANLDEIFGSVQTDA